MNREVEKSKHYTLETGETRDEFEVLMTRQLMLLSV